MTDDEIKKLAAALKGSDKDSFASFTAGLRSNWIFLIAIVGAAMWVFNNFGTQSTINLQQDARIDALTNSVTQLTATVGTMAVQLDGSSKSQAQIQQDVALIKADVQTIKERQQ